MIHIHNGDVVAILARRANIPGEHIAFRESLVSGPITPGEEWIETRAHALSHGEDLLRVRTELVEQEQTLNNAPSRGEVVLWFEHDLFCLVHLVHLLDRFGDTRLSLVWSPTPLGELDEHELFLRFESRAAVTPAMQALARQTWSAYTKPDPSDLNGLISRDASDFPFLRQGLTLHASRFPSTQNGLGAIEQRILSLLSAAPLEFGALFPQVDGDPPRFGFGDGYVKSTLQALAGRAVPLVTISGQAPKELYTITPAGLNVFAGEVDDCVVNEPDQWLGGVHVTKENLWRWDGTTLSRSAVS